MEGEPGAGGGGEVSSAPSPAASQESTAAVDPVVADLQKQVETLTGVVQKTRSERDEFSKMAKVGKQYQTVLGELSPEKVQEIKNNQQAAAEIEERLAAVASEARTSAEQEKDKHYSAEIESITSERDQFKTKYQSVIEDNALQAVFLEGGGKPEEWGTFKKAAGEYYPFDHDSEGFGQLITATGEPFYVSGKPGNPKDLMEQMQVGKFGGAIAACFTPPNGSSGAGLPRTGSDGQPLAGLDAMTRSERLTAGFSRSSATVR